MRLHFFVSSVFLIAETEKFIMKYALLMMRRLICSYALFSLLTGSVGAQALAKPKGPILLTVSGLITQRNAGDTAVFDADMLDALEGNKFMTSTFGNKNAITFEGPLLKSILQAVGAKGQLLKMTATNRYEVSVPVDDAFLFEPVLARRVDGKELTLRTLGPLFMMYPFDSKPQIKNDAYYARAIWQLERIVVE